MELELTLKNALLKKGVDVELLQLLEDFLILVSQNCLDLTKIEFFILDEAR